MPTTKEEMIYNVRKFYERNQVSPKIKDLPFLPFSKKAVVLHFKTWNDMLRHSDVPLNRSPPRLVKCPKCDTKFMRQVKELRKSKMSFCSSACNASFYTHGRKHTEETKIKISQSLKAHRIFNN